MVESDHGDNADDMKVAHTNIGDVDTKKGDVVSKRPREELSDDENRELPSKRPRSEINEHLSDSEKDGDEPVRKANGSAAIKENTMEVDAAPNEKSKAPLSTSDDNIDDIDASKADEKVTENDVQNDTAANKDKAELNEKKDEDNKKKVIFNYYLW